MELLINPATVRLEFGGIDEFTPGPNRWFRVIDNENNEIGRLWPGYDGANKQWRLSFRDLSGYFGANFEVPHDCQDIEKYIAEFLGRFLARFNLDLDIEGLKDEAIE